MKGFAAFVLASIVAPAQGDNTNPIQKVVSLLSGLEAKIIQEGESAQKLYVQTSDFCADRSRQLHFEIKTGKEQVGGLKAVIEKATTDNSAYEDQIPNLAAGSSDTELELKEARDIRAKEAADFAVEEQELSRNVDTLRRASAIIEREMQGGASMAQLQSAKTVTEALVAVVEASGLSSSDAATLASLVQTSTESDSSDADIGAPSPAAYKSQSGSILDTLEGLSEKSESQLEAARNNEAASKHNFELKEQALKDELKFGSNDLEQAKKKLAEGKGKKADAEGDLAVTEKDLAADLQELDELHRECMEKAAAFEEDTKTRGEELKALAEAKKSITESTGGAELTTYGSQQAVSFLQTSSHKAPPTSAALRILRRVAFAKHHSAGLMQLVARVEAEVQHRVTDQADPFLKVRGLISDMLARLEDQAHADASQKAYCDKEMLETAQNLADKSAEVDKLSTKANQMTAKSQQLKEESATLQDELSTLAKMQAESDKLRTEEKEAYNKNKAELSQGLEGIKMALKVLREYYGSGESSKGTAASSIIGLLEVVESDFSKGLADTEAEEQTNTAAYAEQTHENEIARAAKDADLSYKQKASTKLDKDVAELLSDIGGVKEELAALTTYSKQIKKACIAQPESYEERQRRRDAEITGLKEALSSLDGGAVLLQHRVAHRNTLRGAVLSA